MESDSSKQPRWIKKGKHVLNQVKEKKTENKTKVLAYGCCNTAPKFRFLLFCFQRIEVEKG